MPKNGLPWHIATIDDVANGVARFILSGTILYCGMGLTGFCLDIIPLPVIDHSDK